MRTITGTPRGLTAHTRRETKGQCGGAAVSARMSNSSPLAVRRRTCASHEASPTPSASRLSGDPPGVVGSSLAGIDQHRLSRTDSRLGASASALPAARACATARARWQPQAHQLPQQHHRSRGDKGTGWLLPTIKSPAATDLRVAALWFMV